MFSVFSNFEDFEWRVFGIRTNNYIKWYFTFECRSFDPVSLGGRQNRKYVQL